MAMYMTRDWYKMLREEMADRAEEIANNLVPEAAGTRTMRQSLADEWNRVYWSKLDSLLKEAGLDKAVIPSNKFLSQAIKQASADYPRMKQWEIKLGPRRDPVPPPQGMVTKWEGLVVRHLRDLTERAGMVL